MQSYKFVALLRQFRWNAFRSGAGNLDDLAACMGMMHHC